MNNQYELDYELDKEYTRQFHREKRAQVLATLAPIMAILMPGADYDYTYTLKSNEQIICCINETLIIQGKTFDCSRFSIEAIIAEALGWAIVTYSSNHCYVRSKMCRCLRDVKHQLELPVAELEGQMTLDDFDVF